MRVFKNLLPIFVVMCAVTAFAGNNVCRENTRDRTPEQVLNAHFAAILSGDVERIACDYDDDYVIVTPGSVIRGDAGIRAFYNQIYSLMGGPGTLGVISLTFAATPADSDRRAAALLEWTLDSPHLAVGDGTDTFIIKNGRIQQHTVKLGQLVFK